MKADYEHYNLHWEFFKSLNPISDELFFIEIELKKLNKAVREGEEKIDFSNDSNSTIEDYENEMERESFFFNKGYHHLLEGRKAALKKIMEKQFLTFDEVFFVHYQCEDFNDGEQVRSLGIYAKGKAVEYSKDEGLSIESYAARIRELLLEGLTLVHWNQDRPNYGTDHLNNRFKSLTGNDLNLEYGNCINLAEWLIFRYGQNYISHPRLDNLARLNQFHGIREVENGQRTFATNRLMLLTKIYFNALNGTLKTENNTTTPTQTDKGGTGPRLTLRQAAYLLAYRNEGLRDPRTDPNRRADSMAAELCQRNSPTSGGQLYAKFDKLRSADDRQRAFNSELDGYKDGRDPKAVEAILKDVKAIIPLLEGNQKAEAERNLSDWNTAYSSEVK